MFAAVEAALKGDGTRPASPAGPGDGKARAAEPDPAAAERVEAAAAVGQAALKAVEVRGKQRAAFYQKRSRLWHLCKLYERFENDRLAARACADMIRRKAFRVADSRIPEIAQLLYGDGRFMVSGYGEGYGYFESLQARTLVRLGDSAGAARALAAAQAKQDSQTYRYFEREIKSATAFVKGYAAARKELAELKASLKDAPDGDVQWKIVRLCAPHDNRAVKPRTWLEALLTMVNSYPDLPQVERGVVHRDLFHAYRVFEMHEKSVEVADEILAKHEKGVPGMAPPQLHWERADSLVRFAILQEEHGDRGAPGSYRNALAAFKQFKEDFPEDYRSNDVKYKNGRTAPGHADIRIEALEKVLRRLAR